MTGPAGFDPVDGGWGRPVQGHWHRRLPHGIWQHLSRSSDDGQWHTGLYLDAPRAALGRAVEPWERRQPSYVAPDLFPEQTAALRWLEGHRTTQQVAAAMIAGTVLPAPVMGGGDRSTPALDAVAVLIVGGHLDAARSVLSARSGLSAPAADRAAQLATLAGAVILPPDAVDPADTADVLALLTRTISADLGLARARRWARRWLPTASCDRLASALGELVTLPSPPDTPTAVARWQRHLEQVRTAVADPTTGSWPTALPEVADNLTTPPAPATPARREHHHDHDRDREFHLHAGHCPHGTPRDGRTRVDVFFDYSAFPVWTAGGGCMTNPHQLGLPPDLGADLWSWARSHDRRAVPGGHPKAADAIARHEQPRLHLLADRLAHATSLATVVNHPRGHGDGTCPTPRCLGTTPRTPTAANRQPIPHRPPPSG